MVINAGKFNLVAARPVTSTGRETKPRNHATKQVAIFIDDNQLLKDDFSVVSYEGARVIASGNLLTKGCFGSMATGPYPATELPIALRS